MTFSWLLAEAGVARKGQESAALRWVASLGAPGLLAVSLVDATIVPLAIPGSTDLLLLWLISHGGNPWVLVSCAVAGSLIGGWTTWRLGKKGGEAAIERYVPRRLRHRVHGWSQHHPILVLFLPAILPPPIPLAPFLLAGGALGASGRRFVTAFGTGRAIRYTLVAWLAVRYGRRVIRLWSSTLGRWSGTILWVFVALSVAGAALGLWKLLRHKHNPAVPAGPPGHSAAVDEGRVGQRPGTRATLN